MNKQAHLKSPAPPVRLLLQAPSHRERAVAAFIKPVKNQAEKVVAPRSSSWQDALYPQRPGGEPGGSLGKAGSLAHRSLPLRQQTGPATDSPLGLQHSRVSGAQIKK